MYTSIAVLIRAEIGESEAEEFDVEPGTPRTGQFIEEEIERLRAPHSGATRLIVANMHGMWWKTVPNYAAGFDEVR
ncbi:MAG: hypothetical protein H0U65_04530 [Rubrobacter sp.]|nr:hypothetical protein [Rubrobacter sp.]